MSHDAVLVFAKTWGALYLFVFFLAAVIWTYRPSKRKYYEDEANRPLKDEDIPCK
ncbi:MAG: cbb3-type cytochrome c oxidase subunit 3 [Sneathiellales bacterium]|nr:cbb3-type cytochrome c oxidase subunit 3 [Sneathiellales bacterium]